MLEFRGTGGEYFRIWIVNLALTILTLGIYGAWAKVRTFRYFRGNTYLAGHPFDYHASPVRILIGRLIAVSALIGYSLTARLSPWVVLGWLIFFLIVTPWLVVSSLRFNARNTSYRNVRFNFVGSLWGATKAFILWPLLAGITLLLTWPLAHRARDYFIVNNHTFGGKRFSTRFTAGEIYGVYLVAFGILIGSYFALLAFVFAAALIITMVAGTGAVPHFNPADPRIAAGLGVVGIIALIAVYMVFLFIGLAVRTYVHVKTMNLSIENATLEGGHELRSELEVMPMAWIVFGNGLFILLTLGLYYPWAAVRLARYELSCFGIHAASNLDDFTSEAIATQGAIGEEIASFFDLGISL
jgi:uncharacterized membrane protein YjgN (DUF898 family)